MRRRNGRGGLCASFTGVWVFQDPIQRVGRRGAECVYRAVPQSSSAVSRSPRGCERDHAQVARAMRDALACAGCNRFQSGASMELRRGTPLIGVSPTHYDGW